MPIHRALLGKTYSGFEPFVVTAAGALAYAHATNARIAAYQGTHAMAPPMYGVAYALSALGTPLFDPDLGVDMMRLVHAEQDMQFLQAVWPGDVITSTSTIAGIEEKSVGELLTIAVECKNQRGDVVLHARSGLMSRGPRKRDKDALAAERAKRNEDPFESAPVLWRRTESVAPDQSARYAEASGDINPIHLDDDVAKMAGLPGIILHGLCSMAFIHNALVEHVGGDPLRVARLFVRFARPILMGDTLTIEARGTAQNPLFRMQNQAGVVVVANGAADVLPVSPVGAH